MTRDTFWLISNVMNTAILFLFTFMSVKFSQKPRIRPESLGSLNDEEAAELEIEIEDGEEESQNFLRQRSNQGSLL